MKLKINLTLIIVMLIHFASAQKWDLLGNSPTATNFLGTTNSQDLNIKTEQSQAINFYTNAGSGAFGNPRMSIIPNGNVGIGDYTLFTPQNMLHIDNEYGDDAYTQWTNGWTSAGATNGLLVGMHLWDANIIQQENFPLNFYTSNTKFMDLSEIGYLGISNTWSSFSPQNMLHQNVKLNADTWHQFTNDNTGNSNGTSGFALGIRYDGTSGTSFAELRQYMHAPMALYTAAPDATLRERIHIFDGLGGANAGSTGWNTVNGVTKISISHDGTGVGSLPPPIAMLNIGAVGGVAQSGGKRDWMDVGTYYNWDSDNMYVGLKDEGENRKDAVINWGDDPFVDPDKRYEYLRFNFTSFIDNVSAGAGTNDAYDFGTVNGMEVARMTSSGTMGIGPTFTPILVPQARLDIFDDGTAHGDFHPALPQLRLTNTLNSSSALGKWTDFTATTNGDLYIHPSASTAASVQRERFVGINAPVPNNTLEISSGFYSPYYNNGLGYGVSGLRFTYQKSTDTPVPNGTNGIDNTKVLTVDGNGDVVLINPSISDGQFGPCGQPILTVPNEINQDAQNFYFTSSGNGGNVGMGIPCSNTLSARLHVVADDVSAITTTAGRFESVIDNEGFPNEGVLGIAANGKHNIGGEFYAANQEEGKNIGVSGTATTGTSYPGYYPFTCSPTWTPGFGNYGGSFTACGSGTCNVGVYAYVAGNNITDFSGYFDGLIYANGLSAVSTNVLTSDAVFKHQIEEIPNAMNIISQLQPRSYYFNTNNPYGLRFGSEKQYGLIAQDVEEVLPEMVHQLKKPLGVDVDGNVITDSITYKALNYNALFAIMLKGMQEQQQRIDSLVQVVGTCCNAGGRPGSQNNSSSSIDVELSNVKAIILNQNSPNPFSEQTSISYFIPDNVVKAQIIFYDNTGTILKVVDVKEKGRGQLNVFASDLSSGIYTYSLIADGKLIETKHMVCNK